MSPIPPEARRRRPRRDTDDRDRRTAASSAGRLPADARRRLGGDAYRRHAAAASPSRNATRCASARSAAPRSTRQTASFRARVETMLKTVGAQRHGHEGRGPDAAGDIRPYAAAHRGRGARLQRGIASTSRPRRRPPRSCPLRSRRSAASSRRRTRSCAAPPLTPPPPTTTSPRWPTSRRGSATWSSSFRTSPARPICWRSTPPSRRRAPARPGAALPWSPRR